MARWRLLVRDSNDTKYDVIHGLICVPEPSFIVAIRICTAIHDKNAF